MNEQGWQGVADVVVDGLAMETGWIDKEESTQAARDGWTGIISTP